MLNPDPGDTKLDYMMDIGVLLYHHHPPVSSNSKCRIYHYQYRNIIDNAGSGQMLKHLGYISGKALIVTESV